LLEAAKDADGPFRMAVVASLAQFGPEAKAGVKLLAAALPDADKNTRKVLLTALAKMGPSAKNAVPALTKLLEDKDQETRLQVLTALGEIKEVNSAIPALIQLFTVRNQDVLDRTTALLVKIGFTSVQPLTQALDDDNALIRLGAARTLGLIGPVARSASKTLLTHAQKDADPAVRQVALVAYQRVSGKR
jgi:HEAT repeat protein